MFIYMKNYKKYLEEISEGLNSPLDINWSVKEKNHWYGKFVIGKNKYQIFIDNFSDKEKQFLFKFKGNFSFYLINDVKSAMTTIPTIEKAAIDFLKEECPNAFIFCTTKDSMMRRTMYDRFCNKMKRELLYKYEKTELNMSIARIVNKISSM
jgi:hypothetical protein